jgi:hypothetical protein
LVLKWARPIVFCRYGFQVQPHVIATNGIFLQTSCSSFPPYQADRSNWYHPLGLAYFADGAHAEVDELEPGIAAPGATDDSCAEDLSCPAPMYFKDGAYLGTYSNDANIQVPTTGEDDFGLDHYEPLFFHPPGQWTEYNDFSVTLNYPETSGFQGDIFYFCHIHQYM